MLHVRTENSFVSLFENVRILFSYIPLYTSTPSRRLTSIHILFRKSLLLYSFRYIFSIFDIELHSHALSSSVCFFSIPLVLMQQGFINEKQ